MTIKIIIRPKFNLLKIIKMIQIKKMYNMNKAHLMMKLLPKIILK